MVENGEKLICDWKIAFRARADQITNCWHFAICPSAAQTGTGARASFGWCRSKANMKFVKVQWKEKLESSCQSSARRNCCNFDFFSDFDSILTASRKTTVGSRAWNDSDPINSLASLTCHEVDTFCGFAARRKKEMIDPLALCAPANRLFHSLHNRKKKRFRLLPVNQQFFVTASNQKLFCFVARNNKRWMTSGCSCARIYRTFEIDDLAPLWGKWNWWRLLLRGNVMLTE